MCFACVDFKISSVIMKFAELELLNCISSVQIFYAGYIIVTR